MTVDYNILEQSDNKALVISDNTDYTGAPNITPANLDGVAYALLLDVTITTSDQEIVCETINLTTLQSNPGPWTDATEMVFTITPEMLISTTVELEDVVDNSVIQDAVYNITYTIKNLSNNTTYSKNKKVLVNGIVRNSTYKNLKNVPKIYDSYDYRGKEIDDTLLQYALLKSQEAGAYVALEHELLNTLDTLKHILVNGTNYTWK